MFFLSNSKYLISKLNELTNYEILVDDQFIEMIHNFDQNFTKKLKQNKILQFFTPCISGYIIKKSYMKKRQYRIENFFSNRDLVEEKINENDYIILRNVDSGSFAICALIYYIKLGQLCVIKRPLNYDHEIPKVFDREIKNYRKLFHPFIPIFYVIIDDKDYIIIEFINGKTLGHIKKNEIDIHGYTQHFF